ncbi:ATP-dependent DNA helicase RecQ [Ferruginibacter paludis]|uniref:RecQ family ATP-dependent DNA helicase n=1 Tax=Ferruginibacter paludis TaxID=1310417 RepID=UPI0025B5DA96|nr:ATP-dependent DNA helicase RecQ [Ferruginibacter paludis]MDN3657650.1 ATP-dependent DNA helicase RecQ [Ferruginibacter paludis]
MSINQILQEYWGYDVFRPLQEEIIYSVLAGKDTLALLPTGGGKSICFQVPALAKDGICLVISPLIALMKDQVQNLKNKGIPALSVYSGMSFFEVKKTLQNAVHGNYKFLYVSPERLETNLFLEYLPAMNINLIAVDEAHCISQWGYDFRPPYTRIAQLREYLPDTPVLALTASATAIVQDDICEKLAFSKNQQRYQQSFERANLSYSIFNVASKQIKLLEILNNVKGSAIVYCKSRRHTKDIADLLSLNKISASFYHAGLSNEERNKRQEDWINNETRVMACTNAFGMGIDKPNVRVVVHYDVPDCLENYYQEAGRAGRDGKRAYAVLLYSDRELQDLQYQSAIRYPEKEEIKKVYTAIMNHLQIPAGSGEGISYDFDMATFTTAFKLNMLTATYAIKTLEQEDIVTFNELFFKPSSASFTCDKNQLTEFEQQYPQLEPLIKGLLRSYEGIFDFPTAIHENQLANFIHKKLPDVLQQLQFLHQGGIIDYSPRKDKPQLTLLQNRMYADSFVIDLSNYTKRKLNFEKRVQAICGYIQQTTRCRSQFIAAYFNDHDVKACGICDNCINQQDLKISAEEFEKITGEIYKQVIQQPLSYKELMKNLTGLNKEKFWKVFNYLQAEKKININRHGVITKA